jgi:FtsP/CotA-like multicopper oxidase with cupredoxin domain
MLTRRQMLKWGAISGGALLVPVLYKGRKPMYVPSALADGDAGDFASPSSPAFVTPLPIPPLAQEVSPFSVGAGVGRFDDLTNARYYKLVEEEVQLQIIPGLPKTAVWRYRDVNDTMGASGIGPTIKATFGNLRRTNVVRVTNKLPASHMGFGVPCTTVHHHGGHIDAFADGFPENRFDGPNPLPGRVVFVPRGFPGLPEIDDEPPPAGCRECDAFLSPDRFDYVWGNQDPGWRDPPRDFFDRPSTNWYHDHFFDFTGPNVYRGLAGLIVCFDELDNGSEAARTVITTGPYAGREPLGLPSGYGRFDIPLAFTDKLFGRDAQLIYLPGNHDGFLGDRTLVNGAIQPYLRVKRRKYRFRMLTATNARFLGLFLTDEGGRTYPFDIIAHAGGLFARTLRNRDRLVTHMSERDEIVIDFSRFPRDRDTVLYLEDRLVQEDGRGPEGTNDAPVFVSRGRRLLKFIVERGDVADPSRVLDVLRPFPAITAEEKRQATRRTFEFNRTNGAWAINNRLAELDFASTAAQPRRNRGEIWHLVNKSGGWWHPIHVHLEFMRVLTRNGAEPPEEERDGSARDDTVVLGPNDEVEVFFKFRDYPGPFVFHCHNIEHEDMRMMARFDVG